MAILIALLVLFNIADGFTTYKIIKNGGNELNRYVKWLMDKLGLIGGILASKIIIFPIVIIELLFEPMVFDYVLVSFLCVWYGWVVYHNIKELNKWH